MLIATPYRDFDARDKSPPKIISVVRKTYLNSAVTNLRPRISGDLLVKCAPDKNWYQRRVQVRAGQLHVSSMSTEPKVPSLRMPLRHLSLQAGTLPYSLAICRGQNIILTLQTENEKSFDQWVKTIAIELIRQTPVDAIKYLDILTLAESWSRKDEDYMKDWEKSSLITFENIKTKENELSNKQYLKPNKLLPKNLPDEEQEVVETLLKKCQNVETYVPVKEKLFLFESLCKMGRKVRSSEDVSLNPKKPETKRAKSCHDLSNIHAQIAVREICKYFENKVESFGSNNNNNIIGRRTLKNRVF